MKKIIIKWNQVYALVNANNINSFNRKALCFPVEELNRGIEKNPFIIFDHQKNYGKKLGYQKEGIQLNFNGNANKMEFDFEEIFIPI